MLEYHKLANFYPMHDETRFQELVDGMRKSGYRKEFPIVVYENKILDGRNRYLATIETKVEPVIVEFSGEDPLDFVIQANSNRRDLEIGQRAVIGLKIQRYWNELGKKNQSFSQGRGKKGLPNLVNLIDAQKKAANAVGVSHGTMGNIAKIEKSNPELIEKIANGEMTINQAITESKRKEAIDNLENIESKEIKAINGVYDVVVIDPPWDMKKIERDVRVNQVEFDYPTMTDEEIKNIQLPMADDCHVWLWTTHKKLPFAFELLESWNLKYVCTFVWHKNGGFQPVGLPQYNSEFCLYARKGTPIFIDTKDLKVCFNAERKAHSEKPQEFYNMVNRVTGGRRIDMFNRRNIEGFDSWGNEAK